MINNKIFTVVLKIAIIKHNNLPNLVLNHKQVKVLAQMNYKKDDIPLMHKIT